MTTTPRERVWQAVRHRQPDHTPYQFNLTAPARGKLEAHFGTTDLDPILGNHIARVRSRLPYEETRPGFARDEWGVIWNKTLDVDIGVVDTYPLAARSLENLTLPDPDDPRRFAGMPSFVETNRDRFRIVSVSFSLFERAWTLRSMPELLVDMLEAPAFVEELFDVILAYQQAVVERFLQYDVDGFIFGDDWGQQRGLLFSPRLWRRFVKPRMARLYGMAKAAGKAVMIHSCGKVQELFPELIEIGVDVFNPFQPDVMDPYEMKRLYGDRLGFYGGMSVQHLLPHGTPDEIRCEARRLMEHVGRDGGLIIAPSHDMPGDIPLENMLALIEAVQHP